MSTGPGPTRKADGTADASVDDIADLLVEDDSSVNHVVSEETSEDNLDVMLETPGPALVNPFMPPPPSPMGDASEENEGAEDSGAATNLAYEDLLAKLVLPAKAPEPEPEMPALMTSLPLPEAMDEPVTPQSTPYMRPSAPSLLSAPPADESTLVTENPLLAEEQEAAYREGRTGSREQPNVILEEQRAALTEPVVPANGAAKSRLIYLMLGGLLVLGGMILAVLVLKLLMPTPAPQPAALVAPVPLPPPPWAPPAHVEPLPPSAPAAVVAPPPTQPVPAAAPENPSAIPEVVPGLEPERAQPRPHRAPTHARPPRPMAPKVAAVPKPTPAPKAATAPKVAPAPGPAVKAPKAPTGKKPGKSSGYADPFDN